MCRCGKYIQTALQRMRPRDKFHVSTGHPNIDIRHSTVERLEEAGRGWKRLEEASPPHLLPLSLQSNQLKLVR